MFSNDYTNNTVYKFDNELCGDCDNINYVGVCCDKKIDRSLKCGISTDKWVQLFIPEIKDIPEEKPDMENIVSVNSSVKIISQRVIKTPEVQGYTNANGVFIPGEDIGNAECTKLTGKKLIIEGLIKQKVVYTALVENQALHSATFVIPFSAFIIVDADTPLGRKFKIYPFLEDVFTCMLSERSVFSNSTLFIRATTLC